MSRRNNEAINDTNLAKITKQFCNRRQNCCKYLHIRFCFKQRDVSLFFLILRPQKNSARNVSRCSIQRIWVISTIFSRKYFLLFFLFETASLKRITSADDRLAVRQITRIKFMKIMRNQGIMKHKHLIIIIMC